MSTVKTPPRVEPRQPTEPEVQQLPLFKSFLRRKDHRREVWSVELHPDRSDVLLGVQLPFRSVQITFTGHPQFVAEGRLVEGTGQVGTPEHGVRWVLPLPGVPVGGPRRVDVPPPGLSPAAVTSTPAGAHGFPPL